jgi:hypothetical protein
MEGGFILMATETISLDLFVLLVEYLAGSISLAILIWAGILLITGILGRMSISSLTIILVTFLAVAGVGYIGALAAVPLLMWAIWYMVTGIINKYNEMR